MGGGRRNNMGEEGELEGRRENQGGWENEEGEGGQQNSGITLRNCCHMIFGLFRLGGVVRWVDRWRFRLI